MRQLSKYLKGYEKESVLGPLFKLLEASFELLVPLVMAKIIDIGIQNRDTSYIWKMGGVLIVLGVVGLVCSVTAQYFAAKAATGFGTALRRDLFAKINGFSYSQLDMIGTSTLITRMTSDINQVQSGINMALRLLLRSPFIVVGAMVMAFTVNARVAVIFLITIPILAVIVFGILLISMPLYKKVQKQLDQVLLGTRENLVGARVIRAFNRQQDEMEEFRKNQTLLMKFQIFVGRISSLLNPMTYVVINLGIVAVIWVGGGIVNQGGLARGEVVALVNYMSQILVELIKFANLIIIISKALACSNRVSHVLAMENGERLGGAAEVAEVTDEAANVSAEVSVEATEVAANVSAETTAEAANVSVETTEVAANVSAETTAEAVNVSAETTAEAVEAAAEAAAEAGESAGNPAEGSPMKSWEKPDKIRFSQVSFTYEGANEPALQGISFQVKSGQTIGVIGGTGSGKTTLVNLICGFYQATGGSIKKDGVDVKEYPLSRLRAAIGLVPQKAVLFKGSLRDNMRWGKEDATDEEIYRALSIAQAREFVDGREEGLDLEIQQGGKNLSGGQRQRLTIARALVKQPEILILDDSASALDYATDARLRRAILEELGEMTVFFVSQRVSGIRHAHTILVLDDGHLVGMGNHQELLHSCQVYREICLSQLSEKEVVQNEEQ